MSHKSSQQIAQPSTPAPEKCPECHEFIGRNDVRHAQAIGAWIKAGRGHELFNCNSIEEMYALTRQVRK